MKSPKTAIVIGAGDRGNIYALYSLLEPEELVVIAVAEPNTTRRDLFSVKYGLKKEMCFQSWTDLLKEKNIADIAIICTPDDQHIGPAIRALQLGYHVLLEKPMGRTEQECRDLIKAAESSSKILQICHVLRFTEFFQKIKEVVQNKQIGDISTINLRENVSYFHYAHSFIRGNWHNRENSSPMILAKSCHDLDILYWLVNSEPKKISSFGNQSHFGLKNKPVGAPKRCTDGCPSEKDCLYFAPRIYMDIVPLVHIMRVGGNTFERLIAILSLKNPVIKYFPPFSRINKYNGWPVSVISEDTSMEGRRKALQEGPYGKCVYDVPDHDVVDNQVTIIEFQNGITATFTMHGHSSEEGRTLRIDGTKGTLVGKFLLSGTEIYLIDSLTNKKVIIFKTSTDSGHGGGDYNLMKSFIDSLNGQEISYLTTGRSVLISHLMAFAIDKSRLEGRVINFEGEYLRTI